MTIPGHYQQAEDALSRAQPASRAASGDLAAQQLHAVLAVTGELRSIHNELIAIRNLIGELAERGQATDRYSDAIEQLGSEKLDVRIGGIYALERVARDSATDHPTVMGVLTAFIREHSHEPWSPAGFGGRGWKPSTRPDVQAAVTVVGLRDASRDAKAIDLARVILADADLGGANLGGANLFCARLTDATLTFAILTSADLTQANLGGANLFRADLTDATLALATLFRAKLGGATLTRANLFRADLTDADLTDADLTDADLTDARLDGANLDGANLNGAKWSGDVRAPKSRS